MSRKSIEAKKPVERVEATSMRLDKFLKVSRLIKRRSVANDACSTGHITGQRQGREAGNRCQGRRCAWRSIRRKYSEYEILSIGEHAMKLMRRACTASGNDSVGGACRRREGNPRRVFRQQGFPAIGRKDRSVPGPWRRLKRRKHSRELSWSFRKRMKPPMRI